MSPPPPWAADAPDRPGRSRRRLLQRQDRRDSVRVIVLLDHRPPALPASPSRRSPRRPRSLIAARRYGDRRPYPSGQPGEDAASIAVVAPTREVADGDDPPTLVREPSTAVLPSRSAAEVREWPDMTLLVPGEAAEPARRIGEGVGGERESSLATHAPWGGEAERRRRRPPASAPRPRSMPHLHQAVRTGTADGLGACER